MSDQPAAAFASTTQTISARVLAECRKKYGNLVDDNTIQVWVNSVLSSLLTEQTRVTQFVPVLAMREIQERASKYIANRPSEAA
jgi:hypothetical protein